ncbi:hypothetical protein [Blastopirellula marina]|uniref:Uncharacterized protein n=1 Tax=Blastopirellula marina TaxID=124 RepID=A0A2S8GIU8_9BACT|nr:hypothetical protein [Blastopirellula marina]PQO44346.1 hypothetical protein C5Y93_20515 [Blastopirellula marina]
MLKYSLSLLALLFGAIGTLACLAAIIYAWSASSRLTHATESVFGVADNVVGKVQGRVAQIDERVQQLKITSAEMEESVKTWAKSEAQELVGSRLKVQEKAETLLEGIDRADQWLAVTESSAEMIHQGLDASQKLGLPLDVAPAQELLSEIETIQTQLQDGLGVARNISERVAAAGEEKPDVQLGEQIAKLALRVTATLGLIDARIDAADELLEKLKAGLEQEKRKIIGWIHLAAFGLTFFFFWLGAGQGALCYLGWCGVRPNKKAAQSPTT